MEEIAGPSKLAPGRLARPGTAVGLFLAAVLLGLGQIYLSHYARLRPAGVALTALFLPLAMAAAIAPWAGAWAMAGRMLRQKTHFWVHVSIPLLAGLVQSLAGLILVGLVFAFDIDQALVPATLSATWLASVWLVSAHLHWVSRRSFRWIWSAAFISVTALFGLFAGLGYLFVKTFGASPEATVSFAPHFLRARAPRYPSELMSGLPGQKKRLDAGAAELALELE